MESATELFAIMSTVDPVSGVGSAAGTVSTGDQIDMYEFHEAVFIAQAGVVIASATYQLDIWGGATSGTASAVVTGKQSATASTTAAQIIVRVTAEEAAAQSYRYLWPYLYVNGTSVQVSVVGLGFYPRYGPGNKRDLASVAEIVT